MSAHLIQAIPSLQDNYIWAIVDTLQQKACIIDPGEAAPVNIFLSQNNLKLIALLITHHHWDHTDGIHLLKQAHQIPVYGAMYSPNHEITLRLNEGEHIASNSCLLDFHVLAIPGHTLDHIAYYSPGLLFCGDTLFAAGCGKIFEGTAMQMYQSLQKIAALPDDTLIYCAHEYTLNNLYFAQTVEPENQAVSNRLKQVHALRQKNLPTLPSSLREEKQTNPFLRCHSPTLITQVEKFAGQPLKTVVDVFTWLRKWKNEFRATGFPDN